MNKRRLEILLGHSLGDPQRSRSYELERLHTNGSSQLDMMMRRAVFMSSASATEALPARANRGASEVKKGGNESKK